METKPGEGDTPARRGRPLTLSLAERHKLVELWEAGDHTVADLARTFGVSAQTVRTTYRHASGHDLSAGWARPVRAPRLDDEQRRQLVALWEARDLTVVQIAAHFGVSEVTARRTYRRETHTRGDRRPVRAAPPRLSQDQRDLLVELWEAKDCTVAAIAAQFGVSEVTARRTYRRETNTPGDSQPVRASPPRLRPPRLSQDERDLLVELWDAQEHTVAAIAAQFEMSESTARRTYRRETHTRGDRRPVKAALPELDQDQRGRLVELWDAGDHTVAELADKFGLPEPALRTLYRRETEPDARPLPIVGFPRKRRKCPPLKLGKDQRRLLVELWDAGTHTTAELAHTFDLSEATVHTTYRRETQPHGQPR